MATERRPTRGVPSIVHVDLDAFFAAVEQRDKPSLRGRPVVVGGTGPRGVVATASYEARAWGIHSAQPTAQARQRCPRAAVLAPRFAAYVESSRIVMDLLRTHSPLVEPLSLDEAYVDLAGETDRAATAEQGAELVEAAARAIRRQIVEATGLTASVGAGTSKLVAKIASELAKPDGCRIVGPGTELELLGPLPAARLWGVGPATAQRLRRLGVATVADLRRVDADELVSALGPALGGTLSRLARGEDDRSVVSSRDTKSVSAEDTFARDVVDTASLHRHLDMLATRVAGRLRHDRVAGRTVTVKVRRHDFVTTTRSATLPGPTDDPEVVRRTARRLLAAVDTTDGVRLLGVGVSGLADWAQQDLFDADAVWRLGQLPAAAVTTVTAPTGDDAVGGRPELGEPPGGRRWAPGQDVEHREHGRGWVQGAGLGRVTVRFESRHTGPGPVRTLPVDDPQLAVAEPEPLPVPLPVPAKSTPAPGSVGNPSTL